MELYGGVPRIACLAIVLGTSYLFLTPVIRRHRVRSQELKHAALTLH